MHVSLTCLMLMGVCVFVNYLIKVVARFVRYGSVGAKTILQRFCILGFMVCAISVGGAKPGSDDDRVCTIELRPADGIGEVTIVKFLPDTVYKLPKNPFAAPKGKTFAGWQGANGRRYDDEMLVFSPVEVGETLTLTAIWE